MKKKLLKNFSFLTLGQLAEKLIKFFIVIILARHLSIKGYGIYSLTLAFVGLFMHVMDGGLNLLLMREMSKIADEERPSLLNRITSTKLIIAPVTLLFILGLAKLMGYDDITIVCIFIFSLSMILHTFTGSFMATYIALSKSQWECLLKVSYSLILLLGFVFCVLLKQEIITIMLTYLTTNILILLLGGYIFQENIFKPTWNLNFRGFKKLIKDASPFALGAIMGEIFFNIDNVMISKMVNVESVGYYNAAYKLSYTGVLFANSITLAAFPLISQKWSENPEEVFLIFGKIFQWLCLSGLAFSLIACLFADEIILFIFGDKFQEGIILFRILVWSLPPLGVMHLSNRTLDAIGKQKITAYSMMFSVIINIILNAFLISFLGAIGACIATVATSFLIIILHLIYLGLFIKRCTR